MLNPALSLNAHSASPLAEKMRKVITQPYKIPGFLKRQYEHHFHGVEGHQIVWPEPGRALLIKTGMYRPGPGQVLVLTHATLVSPGTERAVFNRLPNTTVEYPFFPGYAGAGLILEVGPAVNGGPRFQPGDRVAADLPHASLMVMDGARVTPVPQDVSLEQACFLRLGIIALQGVRKARIQFGERVAVIGQGLIGQLTTQLVALAGAYPVTAIAASASRLPLALQHGAHLGLSLAEDEDRLAALQADVTIEVSGHPAAMHTALRCTRPGGRIVLLGSTRGLTHGLDVAGLQTKGITLIGAHVDSLPTGHSSTGWWTARREAETFFGLVAQKRLEVNPLISDEIYPSEAERFYRRLAWGDRSIVAGLFRWDQLPAIERYDGHLRQAWQEGQAMPFLRQQAGRFMSRAEQVNGASIKIGINATEQQVIRSESGALRIGLIGCGEIALQNAKAVQAAPNAFITAVADINETLAADLGRQYNVPHTTTTEALLARDDVDAVLISVPHHLHAPLSIQAAQAGKHVIVEKPMAANLTEAEAMLAAAREAGVHLAVLYCQRYLPYVQRAKTLIDQGALGKILGATFLLYQDKPISYYTSGFSGRANTDWRLSKEKSGGGILIFNMVHYLDIFRYLSGLEVVRAFGDFGPLETPLETEDTISVTMRYDNQAIGSLTASAVVRGAPYQPQLRIWGSDGQLVLTEPDQHAFYSLRQIEDFRPGQWHSLGNLPLGGDRQEFVTRFAGAILRGNAPEMSADSGRAVQAIVEAIYRSGEVGRPVAPSTFDGDADDSA